MVGFGYNRLNSLLLTMPAGAIIGTIELTAPYFAYKIPGIRTWLIVICQCGTIIASILLWRLPRGEKGGLLFGCYILASFGGAYAVLMGLQIANTAGYTKRSVTSSGIFVGYCLGKEIWPESMIASLRTSQEILWDPYFSSRKMRPPTAQALLQCWQPLSQPLLLPLSTAMFASGRIDAATNLARWKVLITHTTMISRI